jgi:hypothetical protein
MTTAIETTTAQTTPWIPTDDTFGARLALVRQKMGWGNVKEAALACGLPPESWRTWERDGVQPRGLVDIAEKIADRVGCDFDWLLRGQRVPGRRGRQSTDGILAVAGRPRPKREGRVTTQPNSPFPTSGSNPGFPRTVRIPRKRVHEAA